MSVGDTIFAVSSGAPPAAIAVVRVSGPNAGTALEKLTRRTFKPRIASLAKLRDDKGSMLDEALILWFPGPKTATGEDLAELHCHGGRAVLDAVTAALGHVGGLRVAQPGEFTRRAFANGVMDLAEAESLADLLAGETEMQRAAAVLGFQGAVSQKVEEWRLGILQFSAQLEAALDFSDEDDVDAMPDDFAGNLRNLADEISIWLARPRSEKISEGFRVALAGPPNAGKSTLFNALIESEAAITSPIAGTTRDVIERAVAISGIPFTFVDTAGLRDSSEDAIEQIGIQRAQDELARADVILWLGIEGEGPSRAWEVAARKDAEDFCPKNTPAIQVSAITGDGLSELKASLVTAARDQLPKPGEAVLNARQHGHISDMQAALVKAAKHSDMLLIGEELRRARLACDKVTGRATTEDMLDGLFGRFCIGK